jgi:uncharacterized OsmC-like protein
MTEQQPISVRQAIERTMAAIAADSAKARARNVPAMARIAAGLKCEITGPNGERLETDMPPAMGGAASGPNPGWLLRSALASCTATVIAMRAATLGITLEALEVAVESESDARGILGMDASISAGLGAIRTRVRIRGAASPESLRALVAWADAHSPVACTLKEPPTCLLDVEIA